MPICNYEGEVVGVAQIINKTDGEEHIPGSVLSKSKNLQSPVNFGQQKFDNVCVLCSKFNTVQ